MPEQKTEESLDVLLCGDFTWDRLTASYKRTFEVLGHRVHSVYATKREGYLSPWLSSQIGESVARNRLALRRRGSKGWNEHLLDAASDCDPSFVIILRGDYVMPGTVKELRSRGWPVYIFHPDSPFPDDPNSRPEHLPVAETCSAYFMWSRTLASRLRDRGVHAHYLPFGWDPFVIPYQAESDGNEHDVVFLGEWTEHREQLLAAVAEQFDLKIWGPPQWNTYTDRGSPLRSCWQGEIIRGERTAEVYSTSKVALNILHRENMRGGTNRQTFEVPGSGGFELAPRTEEAPQILPEGKAGAYYGTVDELIENIRYYLEHDEERRSIAKCAHRRVHESHRYRHRARKILRVHAEQMGTEPSHVHGTIT